MLHTAHLVDAMFLQGLKCLQHTFLAIVAEMVVGKRNAVEMSIVEQRRTL